MRKWLALTLLVSGISPLVWTQSQNRNSGSAENPQTIERAPDSTKADLAVPLCPPKFEDGLEKDGIAFRGEESVTPPKQLTRSFPEMPLETRRELGTQGPYFFAVVISGIVEADGAVHNLCLSRSVGLGLDAAAVDSMRSNQFEPAMKDGKPVRFRMKYEVTFRRRR